MIDSIHQEAALNGSHRCICKATFRILSIQCESSVYRDSPTHHHISDTDVVLMLKPVQICQTDSLSTSRRQQANLPLMSEVMIDQSYGIYQKSINAVKKISKQCLHNSRMQRSFRPWLSSNKRMISLMQSYQMFIKANIHKKNHKLPSHSSFTVFPVMNSSTPGRASCKPFFSRPCQTLTVNADVTRCRQDMHVKATTHLKCKGYRLTAFQKEASP